MRKTQIYLPDELYEAVRRVSYKLLKSTYESLLAQRIRLVTSDYHRLYQLCPCPPDGPCRGVRL